MENRSKSSEEEKGGSLGVYKEIKRAVINGLDFYRDGNITLYTWVTIGIIKIAGNIDLEIFKINAHCKLSFKNHI